MSYGKMSIRWRLVVWNVFVLTIILSIVFLGVFFFMKNKLESMMLSKVDVGYRTLEDVLRNSEGDIMDVYHLGQSPLFRVTRGDDFSYQTEAWKNAPWVDSMEEITFNPYGTFRTEKGRLFKLKRGKVEEYNFYIVYAYDVTDSAESIKNLAVILIAGIPLALILAFFGGYFLAGRALSPVKAITRKARQITAESLSDRLPAINSHDEIGQLAATFNQTLGRLEDSFERLRRFTADASHELRTPLTSLRSVGEVALQGTIDRKSCREAIGSMLEETQRLTHLVDSLLILARGDSGTARLDFEPVEVGELVKEVVEELRVLAEDRKQILSFASPEKIGIMLDRSSIRQAFSNIIHNAIRYTQEGGTVKIEVGGAADGTVLIDVIDDGPGIPKSERSKVFERFVRLDKARSRAEGGSGLGLAIARWAVEINGGHVTFMDKDEPGAWCRITLPNR